MARLAQLAAPDEYRPCDWDLRTDGPARAYWTDLFRWHLDEVVVPLVREEYPETTPEQMAAFRAEYRAIFDNIDAHPEQYDRLDVLLFTELRGDVLTRHGFDDPFRGIKRRENEAALKLLPQILAELDAAEPDVNVAAGPRAGRPTGWKPVPHTGKMPVPHKNVAAGPRAGRPTGWKPVPQELLVHGLMAGNIFDLGSRATVQRQRDSTTAFRRTRAKQPPRPWRYDDVERWWRRWETKPPCRHAVFFVDNAGGDILLGCLPLARWMLQAGTRVTLAANSAPALNDITAAELEPLLQRCVEFDPPLATALEEDRLRVAATGSRVPLLDLTQLSDEFVAATADADLIMLHGMGRAIESNFHARFSCAVLRTAVLKDEAVAARYGGKLFDCVFRFCNIVNRAPSVSAGEASAR
ncbi:MAG: DUF89 family protein [Phycisphaerae bacterium]|nr:DUF89 family protein [Phycisphaerae bacterium]